MRLNPRTCLGLVIALAVAVALVWQLNRAPRAQRAAPADVTPAAPALALRLTNFPTVQAAAPVVDARRFAVVATNVPNAPFTNQFAHRLTNSTLSLAELLRSDYSVLLRNALLDTRRGAPAIPTHLRAAGDPGAYIVQARGVITDEFRDELRRAGAEVVSYVPNNAYLVRATAGAARALRSSPLTQAVLPFEPYYKLDPRLLALAVNNQLSPHALLNVVTFPHAADGARAALEKMGAQVVTEAEPTVFGDVLVVKAGADQLAELAQVSEVQMVAVRFEKRLMNDLTRPLIKVSTNIPLSTNVPIVRPPNNYYSNDVTLKNLTGEGVLLAVADSGVDDTHPDLAGRVFYTGVPDYDGHGTHVIGTILGDGTQSPLPGPTNAMGSLTNAVFSGVAPRARAFVQDYTLPDAVMQRRTALTNALISNNSWGRPGDNDYDIFAAGYDAAVRDSLPGVTGEQQVAYVFAAGNEGGGGDNGLNGIPGSIISPATAKNVITVGASDLPRFISNRVANACQSIPVVTLDTNGVTVTNFVTICETNMPWFGMTDTNNQVSPYSSRGNVGIGIEGLYGRFKPDVVAPGSMLVSTRSKDYQEPSGSTNTTPFIYNGLAVAFNRTNLYALTIPPNAIGVTIVTLTNFLSPTNLTLDVTAAIDVIPPPGLTGTNTVTLTPATTPALAQGTLYYTVANSFHSNTTVSFDLVVLLTVTNDVGDYFTVLRDMNAPLKVGNQGYRYEAGTSMSAPAVSGFLALMQEFLGTSGFNLRPSPALLKALVINGARSLSPNYNLQVTSPINHQGWGIANLSNSLPSGFTAAGTNGPMRIYDQTLTNALATGGVETYEITVPDSARSFPLRVTLVWTDPPGNPVTGVKLVNDMNLSIVANLSVASNGFGTNIIGTNTALWLGNNFGPGSDFVDPLTVASNGAPVAGTAQTADLGRDIVNNVENVYIRPPLSRSYTVVVKAHRVNVNAVNSHTNRHAQDYALVISSGNVVPSNNVSLAVSGPNFTNDVDLRRFAEMIPAPVNTNSAVASASAGLLNQRVGANNPLIVSTNGATNQWCFFTYTNVQNPAFTNVVILTFLPPNLSLARNREADIDMYVAGSTRIPNAHNLTNRDDNVISASLRSVGRGGTEYIYLNNAQAGEVFYIGIKSEDQQAANFSIYAESRNGPFSSTDDNGNVIVNAIGPVAIPDGTPDDPGGTNLLVFVVDPRDLQAVIQRVYVTNSIYHEEAGDLIGILSRPGGTNAVTLNNHRTWTGFETPEGFVIYDDSEQGDLDTFVPTPIPPDGPGRLRDFVGEQAGPIWNFTVSDNALFHTGYVDRLTLVIEPTTTNNSDPNIVVDRRFCIGAGRWVYVPVNIGFDVFNMETCLSDFESTPASPIQVYIRQGDFPDNVTYDHFFERLPPGDPCFDLGLGDNPPLFPGRWFIGMFNPNPGVVCLRLRVTLSRKTIPSAYSIFTSTDTPKNLLDDAATNSTIFISQTGRIADLRVGLRVAHERAADLAFHLRSPRGTRVLLFENRGRTNGLGIGASQISVVTNVLQQVLYSGWDEQPVQITVNSGQFASGWRVNSGQIDVVGSSYPNCGNGSCSGCFGGICQAHSLTNAVDLNGNFPGSISTNVPTVSNRTYRLSFAYSKNPNLTSPAQVAVARVDLGSVSSFTFAHALANSSDNQTWIETNFAFRANANLTPIAFTGVAPLGPFGIFLDTVKMEEIEIVTNSFLYTIFTENTNLTVTPIKFGLPPFTNSPNPSFGLALNDGFEFLSPLVLAAPDAIPAGTPSLNTDVSGWHVERDDVGILGGGFFGPPDSGTYYLDINGYGPGQISTNVTTEIGADYELRFAFRRVRSDDAAPVADVRVLGASVAQLTNLVITATESNFWITTTMVFRANSAVSRVEAESLSPGFGGVFLDSFTMRKINLDPALQAYFLPEEPLTPIFGENSFGAWTLEVWDGRLGAAASLSNVLVSWKLEISYPVVNPPVILITNALSQSVVTNVPGDGVVYFAVDVPCFSGEVTHTLRNITGAGGLDLVFNQFTLPTNTPNDVTLLTGVTGTESNTLTIGSPPLVSLTRYYLAVRNPNPGSNDFELTVDFACATTNTFPLLIASSAYCTNILASAPSPAAPTVQYYRYQMPSNVLAVRFETTNASGNVDMAVRPNGVPSSSSGLTDPQFGTVDELVQVFTNTPGIFLVTPTTWYIAIYNRDGVDVNYCLNITEVYDITRLTLNVPEPQFTLQPGEAHYYVVALATNDCSVTFLPNPTAPPLGVLQYARHLVLPSIYVSDLFSTGGIGPFTPMTNSIGDWFIEVLNTNAVPTSYTMSANAVSCFAPLAPVLNAGGSSYSASGFQLRWSASASERYQVQFTDSLAPINWQTITNVISSGDGNFEFLDSGATNNVQRFYRLLRVP